MKPKQAIASEHTEQTVVVEFCRVRKIPIFSIPNGTHLFGTKLQRAGQMRKLKAEGLSPGMVDVCIPCPTKKYHGLFIEMKRRDIKKPSKAQEEWIRALNAWGYLAVVCSGAGEAIEVIKSYFKK